jgi:diguanylate cyclase (GGDEF)-like protein
MKEPANPPDEVMRLQTLQSLNVLDTPAEERFDRVTRVAKRLFGVPIALVSLVDQNRQWFKSCVGLDTRETPRAISFCGHAILGDDLFVVPDTMEDDRFADNPLVSSEPHIRFYAGLPLRARNGSKLGTLCIIDREARDFRKEDLEALRDLALMVEGELEAVQVATLDELTGISNRRGFVMLAQHSLSVCLRHSLPVTLVFLDLDKFKVINDTLGHAEGDRALQSFAEQIRRSCRESDIVARLGGDEFVLLLINATREQAGESINRLRQSIQRQDEEVQRGYSIGFSHGIVEFESGKHGTIEDLLAEADSVMYATKRAKN